MSALENVALIPTSVDMSALTPEVIEAIANLLSYHWHACGHEYERHSKVGYRDVLAAGLVMMAVDRGVEYEAVLCFLHQASDEVAGARPSNREARSVTRVLDFVLSGLDTVRDGYVCEQFQDMADEALRSESLHVRCTAHVTKAAIWIRAKQASPDEAISIAKAFIDETIDMVQDIVESAGTEEADRFLASLRKWVGAQLKRGRRAA